MYSDLSISSAGHLVRSVLLCSAHPQPRPMDRESSSRLYVGLVLMFRLLLFVLRLSTSSGKLVHSFSKWSQSIDSFLHQVDFSRQVFDGFSQRNVLFSKGKRRTSFNQHILTSRTGCSFFNLQGLAFFGWKRYNAAVATAVCLDREVIF